MRRAFPFLAAVALFLGCTPADRAGLLPALSTVDAVGVKVAEVLGWCSDHDAEPAKVQAAVLAASRRDFSEVVALAQDMLAAAAARGEDVPPGVVASVEMTKALLAVQAVESFGRAVEKASHP